MDRLTFRSNSGYPLIRGDGCSYGNRSFDCQLDEGIEKLGDVFEKLAEYEDLEEQGKLLKLPVAVGDTVYVLAECEHIEPQLDGTLYDGDGGMGTATGYYCPYEDKCPFDSEDFESCEKYVKTTAVFEDVVNQVTVDGEFEGMYICTKNCSICGIFGKDVFLTKSEAEEALKKMNEREGEN